MAFWMSPVIYGYELRFDIRTLSGSGRFLQYLKDFFPRRTVVYIPRNPKLYVNHLFCTEFFRKGFIQRARDVLTECSRQLLEKLSSRLSEMLVNIRCVL